MQGLWEAQKNSFWCPFTSAFQLWIEADPVQGLWKAGVYLLQTTFYLACSDLQDWKKNASMMILFSQDFVYIYLPLHWHGPSIQVHLKN